MSEKFISLDEALAMDYDHVEYNPSRIERATEDPSVESREVKHTSQEAMERASIVQSLLLLAAEVYKNPVDGYDSKTHTTRADREAAAQTQSSPISRVQEIESDLMPEDYVDPYPYCPREYDFRNDHNMYYDPQRWAVINFDSRPQGVPYKRKPALDDIGVTDTHDPLSEAAQHKNTAEEFLVRTLELQTVFYKSKCTHLVLENPETEFLMRLYDFGIMGCSIELVRPKPVDLTIWGQYVQDVENVASHLDWIGPIELQNVDKDYHDDTLYCSGFQPPARGSTPRNYIYFGANAGSFLSYGHEDPDHDSWPTGNTNKKKAVMQAAVDKYDRRSLQSKYVYKYDLLYYHYSKASQRQTFRKWGLYDLYTSIPDLISRKALYTQRGMVANSYLYTRPVHYKGDVCYDTVSGHIVVQQDGTIDPTEWVPITDRNYFGATLLKSPHYHSIQRVAKYVFTTPFKQKGPWVYVDGKKAKYFIVSYNRSTHVLMRDLSGKYLLIHDRDMGLPYSPRLQQVKKDHHNYHLCVHRMAPIDVPPATMHKFQSSYIKHYALKKKDVK